MHSSDKKNPRRLARAIEIAQYMLDHKSLITRPSVPQSNVLMIGLTAPFDFISKNIDKRVGDRVRAGIKDEIKKLLKSGVSWSSQSMLAMGYRQWRDYFEGLRPIGPMARRVKEEKAINDWKREEKKYAKRQLTWWKKDARIKWFDISDKNTSKEVEKMVKVWHNRKYDQES